ncbi:MAG: hypothetical protein F6J86_34170, partial [Symploca sp. SIO1B1]|nr:hypothetical protein [Symploca sp. SIO1B1]
MQPLPRDFLIRLAHEYDLSPEQEEAFVARFSSQENELSLAESLFISDNAFRTRMTGVYQKFSIRGRGPGKVRRLHDVLIQKYQQSHSVSDTAQEREQHRKLSQQDARTTNDQKQKVSWQQVCLAMLEDRKHLTSNRLLPLEMQRDLINDNI